MIIELPLETWTELFGFVPRSQLIQLVPHFGETNDDYTQACERHQTIGDRQFVSFLQFFLHKYGEVTLGQLHIRSRIGNEPIVPIVIVNENDRMPLALADVPIPENVKNFKSIRISNFDESVIHFLQELERNSLLTNVHLFFRHACRDDLLQIMTNFMPLFANINSMFVNPDVLDRIQSEHAELATPMLTSTRVLIATYNCRDFWFCDWLHIPREDGKPRVLILHGDQHTYSLSHSHFIRHVKKDFLEANQQAVSFFILLTAFRDQHNIQPLTLENGQTQEKLAINKGANRNYGFVVTISRYPMGINEEEWTEVMSQSLGYVNREIQFDSFE